MNLFPSPEETIEAVSRRIRSGKWTCLEVLERCLARIAEREAQVQAWVIVDSEGARRQAHQLDAELTAGKWRGELHGIPIGIKDIIDVAGLPTAAGSRRWTDRIAAEDATLVARLRDAGAVLLGKTVATQYACFDPPKTRNPWNLDRTPGGSSSGSAAAVACGMCLGAIGSQTGGSITRPASFCGVSGFKPTYGRVSLRGILPLAPSMDHPGPLARSVRSLALLFESIADHDSKSSSTPVSNVSRALEEELNPPRLGRLRESFQERAQAPMNETFDEVLQRFEKAGAAVSEQPLPASFEDVWAHHRLIMASEAAAFHQTRLAEHPEDYLPKIHGLLQEGLRVQAIDYVRAREHQGRLSHEILGCFAEVDVLVCPATIGPAPGPETTGDPIFNSPWSYTGLPTVSLPIGLSTDGLPLGIQLVGPPLAEPKLFAAAAWCEDLLHRSGSGAATSSQ